MIRYSINDVDKVDSIMRHPTIYPWISDDGCPTSMEYTSLELLKIHNVFALGPDENSLFIYIPVNYVTWDMHSSVLPKSRNRSKQLARGAVDWMFTKTRCLKIITWVPEFNSRALSLALKGFSLEGIIKKSYMTRGKLFNQYLLGITKEDYQCQLQ
jgi:hypothetical protein